MSGRTPLALFFIAMLLLGYVLLFERGRPGRTEIASRNGLVVESFVRDRLTRIRIASGGHRVALRREGEGFDETWTVEEPTEAPGDSEAIEDYIRNWEFAMPVRTLRDPSPDDLELFGIETPTAEIVFEMGKGEVRISLGSGAPVDGGGYVRVDEQRVVMVVGKDVVELFDYDWGSFAVEHDAGAPLLDDLIEQESERAETDGGG